MKVRCVRLINTLGKSEAKSPWLTLEKIYHVLEVVREQDEWLLRIMGDGANGVALFPLAQFELLTNKIPESWVIVWGKDDFFALVPKAWNQPGFWERYYDRDSEAIRTFEVEMRKIVDSEP